MILHLDWESYSDLDLTKVGLHNYAHGRQTDLWMGAWAVDDGPARLWLPGQPCPEIVFNHIESGGEVWAHSAEFEMEMCNAIAVRKYGWPHIYLDQLVCTKAMAFAMGLPGTLEKSAAALGVSQKKDTEGKRLMLMMGQPRATVNGKHTWWNEPEKIKRLGQYCLQDLEVEREIGKRMLRLSPYEKQVWALDQKINAKGIKIDVPAVTSAMIIVEHEKAKLIKDIQDVSENSIATPQSHAQVKAFLALHGMDVESIAKAEAAKLLVREDLPAACRTVLEIRAEASKTSTAKVSAMLEGANLTDSRVRGCFQYSGANTRRWAGRRLQLQNLPRTKINASLINDILTEMPKLTADKMRLFYGSPLEVISQCLRGCLVADEGKEFLVADFSSIEARVIAWLANQQEVLDIFKTHGKVYEHAAASIFGKCIDDVTPEERQIGKVAILALGYQGGVGALSVMAKSYNVELAPAYKSLWAQASPDQKDWAEKSYLETGKKRFPHLSREEYIASDLTKTFWRLANPRVVDFWAKLEDAALSAVMLPGDLFSAFGKVSFLHKGSFLFCKLPSGGVMSYPYPEIKTVKTPWGTTKDALTYMSEDLNHHWERFTTYGGSLAENVTQGFARDLLADAMLRLDSHGFDIVAHVHDECICEMPLGKKTVEDMCKLMSEVPAWAGGLPIAATGYNSTRYRKV